MVARSLGDDALNFDRGRRFGKYEILARLSVGGMAEVFLACTSGPGGFKKFVTLKRILPHLREDEDFVSMFLSEARISAGLTHSNIAQVFDLGEEGGEFFLAMEFVPGQNVRQVDRAFAKRRTLAPVGFAGRIVRDTCLALHYAHHFSDPGGSALPIVHRDISPRNVMVTYQGGVKVIDFGIAKAAGQAGTTRAGVLKGTTAYMSPEQLRGEELDGRSDLFSAGIILHELLTGQRLFKGEDDTQAALKVLKGEIPNPHELNPDVPSDLADVVRLALSRDREGRYGTGRDMARALELALGPQMYDEENVASLMRDLFAEDLARTQQLFALSLPSGDAGELRRAAGDLLDSGTGSASSKGEDLPTRAVHGMQPPMASSPTPLATELAAVKGAKVLVVDDTRSIVLHIQLTLSKYGFQVIGCTSPVDAIAVLEREKPDLVMLDVMMPEIDGFQLCRQIREKTTDRYVPVLFCSSACSLEERMQGLRVGGDDFVKKPFDADELVARVRMHLQRALMMRENRPG